MEDIREKTRQSTDLRMYAMDTLRNTMEWVKTSNPEEWLTWTTSDVGQYLSEQRKNKMIDWVNKSGDLIEKTWELPTLLVEDAIKVMKEVVNTNKEGTHKTE